VTDHFAVGDVSGLERLVVRARHTRALSVRLQSTAVFLVVADGRSLAGGGRLNEGGDVEHPEQANALCIIT